MRKFNSLIIVFFLILGCKEKTLSFKKVEPFKNDTTVFVDLSIINTSPYKKICIKVINNSNDSVYIPDIRLLFKNLQVIDLSQKIINKTSFLYKNIWNLIEVHDTLGCYDCKEMIADSFIDKHETENLMKEIYGNLNRISRDSFFCIKKGINLFLLIKPKQIYSERYLVEFDSLYSDNFKIYFKYPVISNNLCECHCDSIKIKYNKGIKGFKLYTGKILSDTIYVNYR